ncbi:MULTISPECIES: ABC transporter permease [unclassified Leucobacter]|uniref:ABC transporter permease n=1 Tax=unclassified Leucobacter TaxID=2621730 RepID=UPI0018EBE791|nr:MULTISPECIES: ABC transporter permease [unclassified Leucobacter]
MSARAPKRLAPGGVAAAAILAVLVLVALLSLAWLPADPNAASAQRLWLDPSPAHPLGTDGSGRDVAARLMAGTRVTVAVLLGTGALAAVIGLALALLGGLGPRRLRETVAVAIDVLVAFPTVLLAMMLAAVFGSGIPIVIAALGVAFGVGIGRVLRSEFRQVSELDYVLAARAVGLPRATILRRHLLPGVRPVLLVQLSLAMGLSVLAEASLSYLGFGAPPEVPSWGLMLAEAQRVIQVHPLAALWPGLAITSVALACYLLGDALRDALDPGVERRSPGSRPVPGSEVHP